jgi:hypothetical protein
MQRLRAALFLVLIGFGVAGSLGGCVFEEDRGGGWGHGHHDHDWR